MNNKELHRHLEWVAANLPLLAMRDSNELRTIVRRAIADTQGVRILLSVAGAVLGGAVGAGMAAYLPVAADSRWIYAITVAICASIFGYLFNIAGEILVHRKIKALANQGP